MDPTFTFAIDGAILISPHNQDYVTSDITTATGSGIPDGITSDIVQDIASPGTRGRRDGAAVLDDDGGYRS